MANPELIKVWLIDGPDPLAYPVIPGEPDVAVHVKVELITLDRSKIFVDVFEQIPEWRLVLVTAGKGFIRAVILVREMLVQLFTVETASA